MISQHQNSRSNTGLENILGKRANPLPELESAHVIPT